ncbi:unnamed protein product, partial [Brassica oleracea]
MDNSPTDTPPPLKRNSNDVGWEYGVLCDARSLDKVKCKLCGKEFSGGVFRMKEHIAHLKGNVSACPVSSPIDQYVSSINPEASLAAHTRQQSIHDAISKEKTHVLREPLLIEEQQRTKEKLKILEEEWEREGCSLMTDAWSDMKRRSIMNLCVNSRGGTCFLSSKDTSKDSHTGEFIFNYIDQCIEDIGADKIVQVVTDNATNKVAAAKMLKQKRPRIFWTGCVAHTVDLMLEGISKLSGFARIIDQAKAVTIFIYAHHKTLSMMRAYAKRDIVFSPLVKVLRLADEEKVPSLGFIFGEILEAKKSIKEASDHLEKNYLPVFRIIDDKMKGRLDTPLHMAAYFLNPNWWATYGCGAPTLQRLATRILALTSSSSGCERNWSSFEGWLVEHVEEPDSDVNFLIGIQAPRVRDLYDDDFESEEEEDIVDMEFEPD